VIVIGRGAGVGAGGGAWVVVAAVVVVVVLVVLAGSVASAADTVVVPSAIDVVGAGVVAGRGAGRRVTTAGTSACAFCCFCQYTNAPYAPAAMRKISISAISNPKRRPPSFGGLATIAFGARDGGGVA